MIVMFMKACLPNGLKFSIRRLRADDGLDVAIEARVGPMTAPVRTMARDLSKINYFVMNDGKDLIVYPMKISSSPTHEEPQYYEVRVKLPSGVVHFVYIFPSRARDQKNYLAARLQSRLDLLDQASYLVYREKAYAAETETARALTEAVKTRTSLYLLPLIHGQQL